MSDTSGINSTINSAIRTNGVGAITAVVLAGAMVAITTWVGGAFEPRVATNAALQAASTANFPAGLWREDFAAGNGAPPLFYYPSGSACSLNSGAGDNGSQVQSADGKCWLARFPSGVMDVAEFGAAGNGTTDDEAAIANDLAACGTAGGARAVLGPRQYYSSLSQTIPANCSLEGNANILPYQTFSQTVNTQAYTLLLGSGAAIYLGTNTGTREPSALRGLNIIPKSYVPPVTMQQALTQVAAFTSNGAGTNTAGIIIQHASNASIIENVAVGGFNLCVDSEAYDLRMQNVIADCTNGYLINNGTNYNWFNNVENFPFLTGGVTGGDELVFTVTGVANDGSGQVQLTISSTTSGLANGNTIYVGGAAFLTARSDLIGKWTISNVSVGGSTTTFSLVGSSYGAQTFTGAVVNGSNYVTGAGVTSALGYFGGAGITDTGSCFAGGTTVKWINPDTNTMYMSNPATCASNPYSITATPVAYGSGGQIDFNAQYRSGYGFKDTNSQGMMFIGTFDFGHQIQYDISTGAFGPNFIGFGCDGSSNAPDPTRICINVEGSGTSAGSMPSFTNGFITDAGIPLKQNTSGSLSGAYFRTLLDDTVVYCNNYLCDEILSGGVQYGAGVQFRSVYQSFVGNSAVLTDQASYNTTASPQMIYQSAGDTANVNTNQIGNANYTGALTVGGIGTFGATVNSIGTGNTVGDYVYDTTAGSANNSWFSPYLWLMNRSNGSSARFTDRNRQCGVVGRKRWRGLDFDHSERRL